MKGQRGAVKIWKARGRPEPFISPPSTRSLLLLHFSFLICKLERVGRDELNDLVKSVPLSLNSCNSKRRSWEDSWCEDSILKFLPAWWWSRGRGRKGEREGERKKTREGVGKGGEIVHLGKLMGKSLESPCWHKPSSLLDLVFVGFLKGVSQNIQS